MTEGPTGPVPAPLPAALTDTSPAGLRAALDADSIGTRVVAGDLPHETHLDPDVAWVVGAPMDPYVNTVAWADFDPDTADRRIAEVVAAYDALPSPFLWWRAPHHGPADLGARLERARIFSLAGAPGMAMDLVGLGPRPVAGPELEVRGVVDEAGIRDYAAVIGSDTPGDGAPPMFPPEKVARLVAYVLPRLPLEPAPFRLVGYVRGQAVATARLSIAGGVAGIYAIVTLPDFRGRGFGAAMTHDVMARGRDLGYRIATLQSTDMGYAIYRRLGFEDVFRYTIHVHLPGGARLDG